MEESLPSFVRRVRRQDARAGDAGTRAADTFYFFSTICALFFFFLSILSRLASSSCV